MKGIVLAGGSGTRLYPLTLATSKQLIPVYDKPMIYYPISTLMLAGITEILVIVNPHERMQFERLLGDGSQWGISLSYAEQDAPRGLADAFVVGEKFIDNQPVALILGDNIFYGTGLGTALSEIDGSSGATVLAYRVSNPSDYGVIEFDSTSNTPRVLGIEEKPLNPKSSWVVPGLYFYDGQVSEMAKTLSPSERGEIEITDLNNLYLKAGKLNVMRLERGTAWLDTGSFETLIEAGEYVRIVERRQGTKIGCPEEVSWRLGFINDEQLSRLAGPLEKSGYGHYLNGLLRSR
jgi:glucose-1-phosphate thymidylyltransferase